MAFFKSPPPPPPTLPRLPVTSALASATALLVVRLALLVIRARRAHKVPHGDGGVPLLARRIRAHGNLTENAALVVVLFALAEAQRALPPPALAALAAFWFAGRLAHAYNMTEVGRPFGPRVWGTASLGWTYLALAAALAVHAVRGGV